MVMQVALKTLVVIHRALREGDAAFREELLSYRRGRGCHCLQMSSFKDDSTPLGQLPIQSEFLHKLNWINMNSIGSKNFVTDRSHFFVIANLKSPIALLSVGLLGVGAHVRAVLGGEARVLQRSEIRH